MPRHHGRSAPRTSRRRRPALNSRRSPTMAAGSVPVRLDRLPAGQRRAIIRQLGGWAGNRAVQRYLQPAPDQGGPSGLQSGLLSGNAALDQVLAGGLLLRRGSRQVAAVRLVQLGLATLRPDLALGETGIQGVDGDFGPRTEAAVRAFQQSAGLGVDGMVGPQTLAALDRQLGQAVTPETLDGADPASHEPARGSREGQQPLRQAVLEFGPGDKRQEGDKPLNDRFATNSKVRVLEWPDLSEAMSPDVELKVEPWRHDPKMEGAWGLTTLKVTLQVATPRGKDGRYRPIIERTEVTATIKLKEAAAFTDIRQFKPMYEEYKDWFGGDKNAFAEAMAVHAMESSSTHRYRKFGTIDGVLFHELLHATIGRKSATRAVKKTIQGINGIAADERSPIFPQVMDQVNEAWQDFRGQLPETGDDHREIYKQEALWYLEAYEKEVGAE